MKILYLHQYFNTPEMSGGTRSFEMARRLVQYGHEVHMITSDARDAASCEPRWKTTNEAGIHVHWICVPYSNLMGFRERLSAFIRFAWYSSLRAIELQADVVFATSTPLTIAIPAIFASRRSSVPMVFEVRDLWPTVPIELGVLRNPILKWTATRLERLAYRCSERIVALAPGMKDAVVATGYPADRVEVIPNGADIDIFAVGPDVGRRLRAETPWLNDRPLILYFGTIGAVNGAEFLVELATEVHKLDPEVCFVTIGGGNRADSVRKSAEQRGILGQSFFMLGAKPKLELPPWVSASTIVLALINGPRALWGNATQNKFFDAIAAGKPVASNFRGFQSIVAEQAGCGLILDTEDPVRAAKELVRHARDAEWLRDASVRATALATREFDRNLLAVRLENVLKEAVGSYVR